MKANLLDKLLYKNKVNINYLININNINEKQLFKMFYDKYILELNKLDIENEKQIVKLTNLTKYMIELSNNCKINDCDLYLKYTNKIRGRIINHLKVFNNNKFLMNIKNDIELVQNILINKNFENDNKKLDMFDFIEQIINEFHNIEIITNILNRYPHYVNLKNNNNLHIVVIIFQMLKESIINNNKISDILYYEKVLEMFLDNDRIKINDNDLNIINSYINKINNHLDDKYINKKTVKYKQINSCIKILKLKLIKSEISQENLNILEEKYDIDIGFSDKVINELNIIVNNYGKTVNPIITIDSEKTTCMDDAVQIDKSNGNYILKVYISNLEEQIPFNSAIDIESSKRFSNIYLPNSVITMLPSELSNNLFSLNTSCKKKVFEYTIVLDDNVNILEYNVRPNYINIDNNLTYEDVNKILNDEMISSYNLKKSLELLNELCSRLRSNNKNKETYRITSDFIKTMYGGYFDKNEYLNRTKSEIITEEIMILTNYISALLCKEKDYPYIYRVNRKIEDTEIYIKLKEFCIQKNINEVSSILNGYAKSKYSYVPERHEGLHIEFYSHSTSPLRRYPDIVNQRILRDLVINNNLEKYDFWLKYLEDNIELFNYRYTRNNDFLIDSTKIKSLIKKWEGEN